MPIKANLVRKTVIDNSNYDYCHLRSVWFEEWKNGKIENKEMIEKWEDRKYFTFPSCLV